MAEQVYRYENKYQISCQTAALLCARLAGGMRRDRHAANGAYHIRSLYFDDIVHTAYRSKVSGIDERSKFRIRYYDFDESYIVLEKKEKHGPMTRKTSQRLDRATAECLMAGDLTPCRHGAPPLLQEFGALSLCTLLRPAVLVDYDRYPFTFPESNVRVTIDQSVCSGNRSTALFDSGISMFPVLPDDTAILEIKMDERLPEHLLRLLEDVPRQVQAVSKYCLCMDICV